MPERLLAIVANASVHPGRCKYCGARVIWATTASTKTHPAKPLPFDAPRPWPIRTDRSDTGVTFEWWPRAALHATTCRARPPRTTPPAPPAMTPRRPAGPRPPSLLEPR